MKIKDIISSLDNVKSKVHVAYRINRCSPVIKQAIAQLYTDRFMPLVELGIEAPDGMGYVEISSYDLVNLYGMEELAALLFLDDLDKANLNNDKTDLRNLLSVLSVGKHQTRMVFSEELLQHVQQNSPDVWENYLQIVEKENAITEEMEGNYENVIENEI